MKFTKIKKTLCFALAMAMLMAFVPMSAMADEITSQTIPATADTYIRQASSNSGTALNNYSTVEELSCTRNGRNTGIIYKEDGSEKESAWKRYGIWSMVQFDLREISVDEGYEIDTVKVKLHVKSADNASADIMCYAAPVEPSDYTTVTWSSYAQQLGTANEDGLMQQTPSANGMTNIDTVTLDGEITDGEAYEFDVTDAVVAKTNSGFQTFVFYPENHNKPEIKFYSMETAEYAPTLTVTLKKSANTPVTPSEPTEPEPGTPRTKAAVNDTYIRGNTANQEKPFGGEATLYCTRDGDASKVNAYCSWPLIQYNLADFAPDEGYEIESVKIKLHVNTAAVQDAKVTCYMSPVEPTDYVATTWSTYATQLGLTAATMKASPLTNGMSALCEVQFDGAITDGEAYEFDVTDAVLAKETLGNQTFVFYTHNSNKPAVHFHSLEAEDKSYAPSMTVTYKESGLEQTITAIDSMVTSQNNYTWPETDIVSIQNNGTSASNRLFYTMFPTDEVKVKSGKAITSAKLRLYVSTNYYYSDFAKERNVRIANIDNDEWFGSSCAWDDAPGAAQILSGATWEGISFSGVGSIGVAGTYYDFDVTEYFTNQYYNNEEYVSFAAHLDAKLNRAADKNGSIKVAAINIHGALAEFPPQLVLTYGDEKDLAVTGVTFGEGVIGKNVTELGAEYATDGNTMTYANVAMSAAGNTAKKANLFLAQYNDEGALVGVDMREFEIYSADGTVTHSFIPTSLPDTAVTKAFVWNADMSALLTTPASINTVDNVEGEAEVTE